MRSIRLFLYFVVGLLLGGLTTLSFAAASVPLSPPSNVGGSPGAYVTKPGASISGASFNSGFTTQVAGKAVVVPATFRLASNAARFAVTAVRATPQSLVVGAVVTWLANGGIQWISGQFQTQVNTETWTVQGCALASGCGMPVFSSPQDAANYACTSIYGGGVKTFQLSSGIAYYSCNNGGGSSTKLVGSASTMQPPTDVQWEGLSTAPLPDAVATQLAPLGLPLQNPTINPNPIKLPLGSPYYNPVTKQWYQRVATITPGTNDTGQATVTIDDQQVNGPAGDPVTDPAGDPVTNPQDQPDPCDTAPNRLACLNAGDPPDVELQTKEIPVSITPWGNFGAQDATCPADQRHTLRNGQQLVMSWAPVCQMATTFRPVIIGFAWITAALIFLGIQRRNS